MKMSKLIKGHMRFIPYWPLFLIPAFLVVYFLVNLGSLDSGVVVSCFGVAYLIFAAIWLVFWRHRLLLEISKVYDVFDKTQLEQVKNFPMPYVMIDGEGMFLWENDEFTRLCQSAGSASSLTEAFPQLSSLIKAEGNVMTDLEIFDRSYRVELYRATSDDVAAVIFFDETELLALRTEVKELQPIVAQINVDNYEEVMASIELIKRPVIAAFIENKINKYFAAYGGVVSKTDKDKFVVYLNKKGLNAVVKNDFSILEEIKKTKAGDRKAPTISIGIGEGAEGISANNQLAVLALELCLGRGGDQAVIKTPTEMTFFGGKLEHTDKSTRVKARIVAQALKELISSKQKVLVMGHDMPDADSLGSAVGIYRIARYFEKEAKIVIGNNGTGIEPMLERLRTDDNYGETVFVSGDVALDFLDKETLVVLVDVNRPSYSGFPEILKKTKNLIVIDHHRQNVDTVENPVLSYIEPYASSAAELVTELIQYISDAIHPTAPEADALYAGIVVDTDNFLTKTGTRTFEAAAYLRRCGADMARVRKLFREEMDSFKAKADVIKNAELFMDCYAIGRNEAEGEKLPTVTGSQAANDLLDIKGVKASFVFTPFDGKINISARSIDEVNVQLIMEKIGGGGHLSVAGAQLACSMDEAINLTKEIIRQMV